MPHSIQQLIAGDAAKLAAALALDTGSARLEVQYLQQHVLRKPRAWLLAHPEAMLDEIQQAGYNELLQRRLRGEPIAYLLGEREFYGLDFKVSRDTLIPRPETELLVELALQCIPLPSPGLSATLSRSRERGWGGRGEFHVLDLGTGSGAIALSIGHARPDIKVTAVDASPAALAVAQGNAQRLGIANAALLRSDWFAALAAQRFDLIVSNPPYVATGDPHLRQGDLRFEPASALASGADGLDDIRRIVSQSPAHLQPGGWLLLEHGYDQAARVRSLLQQAGLGEVFSACDLSGIERVSGARAA